MASQLRKPQPESSQPRKSQILNWYGCSYLESNQNITTAVYARETNWKVTSSDPFEEISAQYMTGNIW